MVSSFSNVNIYVICANNSIQTVLKFLIICCKYNAFGELFVVFELDNNAITILEPSKNLFV